MSAYKVSSLVFSYRLQKPLSTVNHVTSKSSQSQNKTKIPNSISENADRQIEPCNRGFIGMVTSQDFDHRLKS